MTSKYIKGSIFELQKSNFFYLHKTLFCPQHRKGIMISKTGRFFCSMCGTNHTEKELGIVMLRKYSIDIRNEVINGSIVFRLIKDFKDFKFVKYKMNGDKYGRRRRQIKGIFQQRR